MKNDDDFFLGAIGTILGVIVGFVCMLFVAFCFSGCATAKPISNVQQKDSVRLEYRLDSVYLYERDSIYVDRWRSNDTVYLTVEKWLTRYKDKLVEKRDTITIDNSKTETVQVKYIPTFYNNCTWGFWLVVVGVVLFVVWRVAKFIYLRK